MGQRKQGKRWGELSGGREAKLYTLENDKGYKLTLSDLGATIVEFLVPTASGDVLDVVLGYDTPAEYEAQDGYLGAVVGRVGNRLGTGGFRLDDKVYRLSRNEGDHTLHGGEVGFDKALWLVDLYEDQHITFRHVSKDGDQGFPGEVIATVSYTLTDEGQVELLYQATADKATPINLTNHVYFNLDGPESDTIASHEAQIEADLFTPVDSDMLPDGSIRPVEGTGLDFRTPRVIADALDSDCEQIRTAGGVDHNFVLRKEERGELSLAAAVHSPRSELVLVCYTTQPGIQFYTGNFLTERSGKGGKTLDARAGFCLETQHFPNSMLQTHFPDPVLRPGEVWEQQTVFGFVTSTEFRALQELMSEEV